MNKGKIFICVLIGLAVIIVLSIAPDKNYDKDNTFSCESMGFIHVTQSERVELSGLESSGGKEDVLECENISMYLGGYKQ